MDYPLVSIIVPAFNENESLEELCSRIKSVFDELNRPFELIIVDDGSTDGSFEKLESLASNYPNLTVLRHYKNHGKSLALMQGFDEAKGEFAITIDADLQDPPEEIPKLLQELEKGYEFVNGRRLDRKDEFKKRFISKVFNLIISLIFNLKIKDVNCGYKAFTKKVYKWLDLRGDLHRLIPVIINHKGFKCSEVEVNHQKRKFGKSKYKLIRYRGLLDIIALSTATTTQIRPFHFFCEVAFFFFVLACITLVFFITLGEGLSVVSKILFCFSLAWLMGISTFLPFWGYFLEINASYHQGREWRKNLIEKKIDSDLKTDH